MLFAKRNGILIGTYARADWFRTEQQVQDSVAPDDSMPLVDAANGERVAKLGTHWFMRDLERPFAHCATNLKLGGLLFANDYIGPSRCNTRTFTWR